MQSRFRISLALLVLTGALPGSTRAEETPAGARTIELKSLRVTLAPPVLVHRSAGFNWFPTIIRRADGELLAMLNNYADQVVSLPKADLCTSDDGGRTWTKPVQVLYGDSHFPLPGGDELILPYNLRNAAKGEFVANYQISSKVASGMAVYEDGLRVKGMPRPDKPYEKKGVAGFNINGIGVKLADGSFLQTMYGYFANTKRCALVLIHSTDGRTWNYRATVADENCPLEGRDGPTEAAMCRTKDGRLMCIFRLGAGVPYGQTFSDDDGRTWSDAVAMKDVFSVQPCLVAMPDGAIVLSGGRPGLFLWINADGTGQSWQKIDTMAHHNASHPDDAIRKVSTDVDSNTTAYSRIVQVEKNQLLYIYDVIPHGWHGITPGSKETNSVWVARATVERQ